MGVSVVVGVGVGMSVVVGVGVGMSWLQEEWVWA